MKKQLISLKRLSQLVYVIGVMLLCINLSWGQQVIGSFPTMDGGFEGQASSGDLTTLSSVTVGVTQSTLWTQAAAGATYSNSSPRTGARLVKYAPTSGNRRIQSPTAANGAVLATTAYTIQYYYRTGATGTTGNIGVSAVADVAQIFPTTAPTVTNHTPALALTSGAWAKATISYTTPASAAAIQYGCFMPLRSGSIAATYPGGIDIDDAVMYAGAVDVTAPDAPTVAGASGILATQQTISWTAAGDTDGGGYMVVRGTVDPATTPNANGIYAVGNTVAAGETVVYIGTGTSFTDIGLTASTQYYYRIYTVDKAFNYSTALSLNSTTAGAVVLASEPTTAATGLVFSNVTATSLDISWTAGNGSNSLVVVKATSDVNADPIDGTIYTPSLTFGSGTQIGSGNYTVYKGAGTTASITGLSLGTTYFVKVYSFNVNTPGSENYLITAPATGNKKAVPAQSTFTFNATTEGYTTVTRLTTPAIITESSRAVLQVTPNGSNNLKGIITNSTTISRVESTNKYAHITLKNTSSFDKLELGVTKGGVTPTYISAAQTLKSGDTDYTTYDFDLTTWDLVDQFPSIAFSRSTTWSASGTYAINDIVVVNQTFYQRIANTNITTPLANSDWTIINGDTFAGYPQTTAVGNAISVLPIYIDSIVYDNVPPTIVSNGTGGGTWGTGATWAGGIAPTSTSNVTIASGDIVNSTVSRTINKITINSGGTLSVSSSSSLTVTNDIVNNGILTIANNSNLIQTALANTNSGSGTATVIRNSNPLFRLDYTMWSSPVSGSQTLEQFSPLTSQTPNNRFFTYNAGTDLYVNVSPTSTFSAGTGYLIRMPNEDPTTDYNTGGATLAYPGQFTGTLNNGTVSVATNLSGRYYSVGNPYPSTIDAALFLGANTTDGTLYFWRKTNATANSTGSAYATWTTFGSAASNVAPNNIIPNGTIQVGQGFIVKSNGASLSFTNAMRIGTVSTQFFKTKQATEKSRIWLNLTNTTGAFSQALIGYVDGATLGIDNGIDGKYINDSAIALSSNINGEEYTIQGRPAFDATDIVALNFKTDVAGDYTIAIDHKDGVFAGAQDIYLLDSKTGIETDLKADSYTFSATTGVDNARFSLKYQKTLKVDAQAFNDSDVRVYQKNGTLYVNSLAVVISNIKVFDIQGRLIAEHKNVKANSATISNLKATNQALIVRVTSEDNQTVNKKILN